MRVLISAYLSTNSAATNNADMMALAKYLVAEGLQFETAMGVYPEQGQQISTKCTYVVHVNTEGYGLDQIDAMAQSWAEMAAEAYQQDFVGIVFDGDFYLAYPNAPLEHIGPFREVTEQPKGKTCIWYRGKWHMAEAA